MAQSRYRLMLGGILIASLSVGSMSLALQRNLGTVDLFHGLQSDNQALLVQARQWLEWSSASANLGFAQLALFDPVTQADGLLIRNWQNPERGHMTQVALAQFARQQSVKSKLAGQIVTERAWRVLTVNIDPQDLQARQALVVWLASVPGDWLEASAQYEQLLQARPPTWQDYLGLIALNLKAGNATQAARWHRRLLGEFPETAAYMTDLQNPYAQSALAEAYAALGLVDDAVRIGEQALAVHNWDWGHYVIAGYYRQLKQFDLAEQHYLAAIARATTDALARRYRLDLADLYREQGKRKLALAQLCQVVKSSKPEDTDTLAQAQTELLKLDNTLAACEDKQP